MNLYQKLLSYLYFFISDRKSLKFSGQKGVERTKYLLKLLGDPQEKLNVIHIAGTSGKGSTAYLISALLHAHGFKTGLYISPHLVDIRERFQINNQLITKELFIKRFKDVIPSIEKAKGTAWGRLTYFEILAAFTFYLYWKEKVDFAVMETGLGGLYDATNVVNNPSKVAIITRIGLDHQFILGRTMTAIAGQKAGIIHKGNEVITVKQRRSVMQVFEQTVRKRHARLDIVQKYLIHDRGIDNYQLGLKGDYQLENASLAIAAVKLLSSKYHFKLDKTTISQVFKSASFPGRFEIHKTQYRQIIIDGAHNPQKMKAFTDSLKKWSQGNRGNKGEKGFDFLISFSRGKKQTATLRGMLKYIVPISRKIYLASFVLISQDSLHQSVDPNRVVKIIEQMGFKHYEITDNDDYVERVVKESHKPLIITGSLYFIGSIYRRLMRIK